MHTPRYASGRCDSRAPRGRSLHLPLHMGMRSGPTELPLATLSRLSESGGSAARPIAIRGRRWLEGLKARSWCPRPVSGRRLRLGARRYRETDGPSGAPSETLRSFCMQAPPKLPSARWSSRAGASPLVRPCGMPLWSPMPRRFRSLASLCWLFQLALGALTRRPGPPHTRTVLGWRCCSTLPSALELEVSEVRLLDKRPNIAPPRVPTGCGGVLHVAPAACRIPRVGPGSRPWDRPSDSPLQASRGLARPRHACCPNPATVLFLTKCAAPRRGAQIALHPGGLAAS